MKVKEAFNKPPEAEQKEQADIKEEKSYHFQLSDDKKKEITQMITQMVQDYGDSRTDYMELRKNCVLQYEGIKPPKDVPWPDCSNLSTMVTTVAVDILHAKLFAMAWNVKSLYWEAAEEHDIEVSELNKKLMSWVVSTDMALQDQMDDFVKCLLVDGTVAVKKIWKPYWVYVTRKMPKEVTPANILTGKLEYTTTYDYIRRERCFLERRPLEYVYFPYDANSSERNWEDTTNIIDERWYTIAQLREMKLDGIVADDVDIDKLCSQDVQEYRDSEKARMDSEGTQPVNTLREYDKVKCYEAEVLYDIDGDGRRERCVFFMAAEPQVYLGGKAMHCVSRIGRSSWVIRPFLRMPGRVYGKGIPELVRHHQAEMDAIHNQRIDAGNMMIAPFFFYRSPSNLNPRRIVVGPATGVPVDNPDQDVRFPQFPTYGLQVSFQEEKLVWDMIERLTYLTPAMMGQETASRPTARGTLAIIQQGEQKFTLIGMRVQNIICAILTDIRQMYEERMPPETWERIMGRDAIRKNLSPEAIIGQYDARMQLDLTAGDPNQDAQMAVTMFQNMAMDPMVMQNPAFMWEVRADYLKALKRTPVEKYIGPKPPTVSDGRDVEDIITLVEQEIGNIPLEKLDPATILPHLMEFQKTQRYLNMTPEAKAVLTSIIRDLKELYVRKIQEGVAINAQQGNTPQVGGGEIGGQAPGVGGFRTMGSTGPNMPGAGARPPIGPGAPGATPEPSAFGQ